MSTAQEKYTIGRATGVCAASGETLEPGRTVIACLCERDDDDAFERLDYSLQAWETDARPPRLFSFWRHVVPEPNAKKRVFVDDDLLLNLFERLEDDERPQRVAFRFVIALILMRKKLLKYIGREGEGATEHWLVHPKGVTAEQAAETQPIRVHNPHLSEDDVRDVSEQLSEILNGELE